MRRRRSDGRRRSLLQAPITYSEGDEASVMVNPEAGKDAAALQVDASDTRRRYGRRRSDRRRRSGDARRRSDGRRRSLMQAPPTYSEGDEASVMVNPEAGKDAAALQVDASDTRRRYARRRSDGRRRSGMRRRRSNGRRRSLLQINSSAP